MSPTRVPAGGRGGGGGGGGKGERQAPTSQPKDSDFRGKKEQAVKR